MVFVRRVVVLGDDGLSLSEVGYNLVIDLGYGVASRGAGDSVEHDGHAERRGGVNLRVGLSEGADEVEVCKGAEEESLGADAVDSGLVCLAVYIVKDVIDVGDGIVGVAPETAHGGVG